MSHEEFISREKFTVSPLYSPGIVSSSETIARVLLTPKHIDDDGNPLPAAFSDIFKETGFSVLRENGFFSISLKNTIELLESDGNKYFGYTEASVESIRMKSLNGFRIFIVLDTARKTRKSHADIIAYRPKSDPMLPKKALKIFIRKEISEVFNKVILSNT